MAHGWLLPSGTGPPALLLVLPPECRGGVSRVRGSSESVFKNSPRPTSLARQVTAPIQPMGVLRTPDHTVHSGVEVSVRVRAKHLQEPWGSGAVVSFLPRGPTDKESGVHRLPGADRRPGRPEHESHFCCDHAGASTVSVGWGLPPNCNHLGPSSVLGSFPLRGSQPM